MLLKYGGVADKSDKYNENEHAADQGMTNRIDRADREKNTQAHRKEDSATNSRSVLRVGTDGTVWAADWEHSAMDARRVSRGGAETVRAAEGEQPAADSTRGFVRGYDERAVEQCCRWASGDE